MFETLVKGLPIWFELILRQWDVLRDKWKDVFVRIFWGPFEICGFHLGIFSPQSPQHSTDWPPHSTDSCATFARLFDFFLILGSHF